MKYFTPELLEQLNSRDELRMMAAMTAWDQNERRYEKRLQSLASVLPASALRLVEEHYFHDAQVVTISYSEEKSLSIILRSKDKLRVLTFLLNGNPILREPEKPPAFASEGLLWLYEELDRNRKGALLRLLLSNGSELEIPFTDVNVNAFEIHPVPAKRVAKGKRRDEQRLGSSTFDFLTPALPFSQQGIEKVTYRIARQPIRARA